MGRLEKCLTWRTAQTLGWYHAFLLLLLLILKPCTVQLAVSAATVDFLPGFSGPLPFQLETGYVGVGESEEVQLFYYFVKSDRNPQKDPLLIWLTGGPGCSAWSGFVYEVGPLSFKIEPYNGSLPTLVLNQHSWTKISSIIFIDSPVGAGFSYAKTSSASKTGDLEQVQGLSQFLKKWLIDHPEFISNPIYIAGDSYSGIIVPVLVQQISNGIKEGILPPINLEGYILGNPVTGRDGNYRIPFAHGMALISDELYKSLEKSCGGEYYENIDPNNSECLKEFEAYEKDYPDLLSNYWANDPGVRRALHVRKGSKGEWKRCNYSIPYEYIVRSSVEYHANLSAKGYRSLIYSGDHDMEVPFLATQAWIRSLNYSIVDDWKPWIVQGQIAGYTRTYSNRMTFATVKVAGHTAPKYKPKECFDMFKRWIHYEPL